MNSDSTMTRAPGKAPRGTPPDPRAAIRAELEADGFYLIPLREGSKIARVQGWTDTSKRFKFGASDNVGIFTGAHREGGALLVLDVDLKAARDGEAALRALEDQYGTLPLTREHTTASGGRHIIFRVSEAVQSSAGTLGVGLDVRSGGGYIVSPGSAVGGKEYTITCGGPIADAPRWLVELCGQQRMREANAAEPLPGIDADSARERAIHYLEKDAPQAVEGDGGDATTYRVACVVKDKGISDAEECASLMLDHWNERQAPPWAPDALAEKVRNAYAYGVNRPGVDAPEAVFSPVPAEERAPAVASELHPETKPAHVYRLRDVGELLDQAPPQWLVRDLLPERGLGIIYGAPTAGKSFIALDLAAAIARGVPWLDRDTKQGTAVYVGLEGRQQSRLEAYLKHHRLTRADLRALRIVEGQPLNLLDATCGQAVALAQSIEAQMPGPIRAVFIDTLSRAMPGGNENASETMTYAVSAAQAIANRLRCLVLLVHHSGKDSTMGARGHSSLHGAADAEIEVLRPNPSGDARFLRAAKVKDGEDGARWEFALERVELPADSEGKPRGSLVVASMERAKRTGGDTAKLATGEAVLLMALRRATEAKQDAPGSADDVFAETIVTRDEWRRAYFAEEGVPETGGGQAAKTRAAYFRTTVPRLVKKGFVNDRGPGRFALPC